MNEYCRSVTLYRKELENCEREIEAIERNYRRGFISAEDRDRECRLSMLRWHNFVTLDMAAALGVRR